MTDVDLQAALIMCHKDDPTLDKLAKDILANLGCYLNGTKGFFVKRMVRMVKNRFERDGIDDAAFGYIISKLLRDFDALDDLYSIFDQVLNGDRKKRADLIVNDIQQVLNGKLIKAFTKEHTPKDFANIFESKMIEAGLETSQAAALAKVLWQEVQHKLGV
jgi:hypothetical protein